MEPTSRREPTQSSSVEDHVRRINALVIKLERAEKDVDSYQRSIGQHIAAIKKARPDDWEKIVRDQCDLGRRSAYVYMAIADGRKSVDQHRSKNREAVARHRSALRNAQDAPPTSNDPGTKPPPAPIEPRSVADAEPAGEKPPPELPAADAPLDRRSYCPVCEGEGKLEDGEEDDVVFLAWSAREIASMLIAMDDQTKLKKIAAFIRDHLKHPNRTWKERQAALGFYGMDGLDGPLTKKQVLERLRLGGEEPQKFSWRVDAIGKDGKRYRSGVRLKTEAEAEVYRDIFATFEVPDYASAEIIRCDDEPKQSITRKTKGGRPYLGFWDGQCHLLHWHPIDDAPVAGNDDGLDVPPFLDRSKQLNAVGKQFGPIQKTPGAERANEALRQPEQLQLLRGHAS